MKTHSLFGFQFLIQERFKNELLDNFEHWKIEKQRFFLRFGKAVAVMIHIYSSELEKHPGIDLRKIDEMIESGNWKLSEKEMTEAVKMAEAHYNYCNIELKEVEELLQEGGCKQYYITASVLKECKLLKTKKPYDVVWLEPIPDGKRQLNFGNQFIRYQKRDNRIIGLSARLTPRQERAFFEYTFFHMDLIEKTQSPTMREDEVDDYYNEISSRAFEEQSRELFFQLISFMELAPLEEIYLPAGRKHGQKKSPNRLLNETSFPIIIVSANWNRNIHIGKFMVNHHYRLQACGPGQKYRTIIFICPFYKNGYNLKALKTKET